MPESLVVGTVRQAIEVAIMVSLPMLLAGLIAGVLVSIFQTVTSIQDNVLAFIPRAAAIGCEAFVIDAGWYTTTSGKGRNWKSMSGDWAIDRTKFPQGLKPIIDQVHDAGMKFGLWLEPEPVGLETETAKIHPEWYLSHNGKPIVVQDRLHLDFAQPEVREHSRRDPFALTHDSEEQVLRPDIVVMQASSLLTREIHHLPNALGKPVMHRSQPPSAEQTHGIYQHRN